MGSLPYTVDGLLADELDRLIEKVGTARQVAAVQMIRTGVRPTSHKDVSPNFLYGRENVIRGSLVYTAPDWVKRTSALVKKLSAAPALSRPLQKNVEAVRRELGIRPKPSAFNRTTGCCVYAYTRENEAGRVKVGKSSNGWGEIFKQGRGASSPAIPLLAWTTRG